MPTYPKPDPSLPHRKSGVEIMDEMVEAPTLDRFFDNDPDVFLDDTHLRELIDINRRQRAVQIEKDDV